MFALKLMWYEAESPKTIVFVEQGPDVEDKMGEPWMFPSEFGFVIFVSLFMIMSVFFVGSIIRFR